MITRTPSIWRVTRADGNRLIVSAPRWAVLDVPATRRWHTIERLKGPENYVPFFTADHPDSTPLD